MKITQACKYALDHRPADEQAMRSHAGAARFAYNWGLAKCKERYAAERKWYSAMDLHKLWNAEKKTNPDLAWWPENSKCAYQEAFRNLERALKNFTDSKKGRRKGPRVRFPKRKKKGKSRDSFRLTGVIRCAGSTVTLPRLGTLKTHESTGKLARMLEHGTGRILSATVSRTAQRWFVSFAVEVERDAPGSHARPGSTAGIDLGVKALLTGVDDRGVSSRSPGGSRCAPACGNSAARPERTPASSRTAGTGASPPPAPAGSTPGSPASARTRCTRQRRCSPAGTRLSWSRT